MECMNKDRISKFSKYFYKYSEKVKKIINEKGNTRDEDEDDRVPAVFPYLLSSTFGAVIALFIFFVLCLQINDFYWRRTPKKKKKCINWMRRVV